MSLKILVWLAEILYVIDQRTVLTGMLAPRGQNQISFFNKNLKFIGSFRYIQSRPLWCEGLKLFLFGDWDGAFPGDDKCATCSNCNLIQWDTNQKQFKLLHEKNMEVPVASTTLNIFSLNRLKPWNNE